MPVCLPSTSTSTSTLSDLDSSLTLCTHTQPIATDSERKWFSTLLSDMHVDTNSRLQLKSNLAPTLRGRYQSSVHVLGLSESEGGCEEIR
jgi:hypothetical protein